MRYSLVSDVDKNSVFHDEEQDVWEVTLFVSLTETLGGEQDGKLTGGRFSLDLTGLASLFSEVERFSWQAASLGADDDLGSHLAKIDYFG